MEEPESLERRLRGIEERLAALERRSLDGAVSRSPEVAGTEGDSARPISLAESLPHLGRTLVIIGGAFVLRAATEAGIVRPAVGAGLGLAYAGLWLVLADRAAARGRLALANWFGVAAMAIAFPLLWEATIRFGILAPVPAAAGLILIASSGAVVAWRGMLVGLVWTTTSASVGTALALAFATHRPILFTSCLFALGVLTTWLGQARKWTGLAWLVAIPTDLLAAMLALHVIFFAPERLAEAIRPQPLVLMLVVLPVVWVGPFVARTISTGQQLRAMEIFQGSVATAVGMGGAVAVARAHDTAWVGVGLVALALAVAAYVASFTSIDRSSTRTNFIFTSSLALVFVLVAGFELLASPILAITLALGAVLMAWIGASRQRATLDLHAAVYAVCAMTASGLLPDALEALLAPGIGREGLRGPAAIVALTAAIAYCAIPVATHGRTWGQLSTVPKLVVLTLVVVGSSGALVRLVAIALPGPAASPGPEALAVARTWILAAAAVALALLGRRSGRLRFAWLAYAVLAAGGLKLIVEDIRVGRPLTLVLSLAVYGGALILVPRLALLLRR